MKTIVEVAQNLIKPYIGSEDKKYAANVAPVETSPATAAHIAGTQIIYNGVLYDVTADINANDPLATTGAGANIAAADKVSEQISNVKQALSNEVVTRAELGAHNLLPFSLEEIKRLNTLGTWVDNEFTAAGVKFTLNVDGSVSTSGAGTNPDTPSILILGEIYNPKIGEKYKINGVPSGAPSSSYQIFVVARNSSSSALTTVQVDSTGGEITIPSGTVKVATYIRCYYNVNMDGKIFYPMIRLATDSDPTYQPYAMTNKELTDAKANKSDLASISITGTTNNTGATILAGTYFYLDGTLVRAIVSIASNATFTLNTNYEVVTAGGLNSVPHFLSGTVTDMQALPTDGTLYNYTIPEDGYYGTYAINEDVAGVVGLAILDLNSHYICSIPNTVTASYQRAACPPIPLRKGTTLVFRAWATDRAYIYKLT